MILMDGHYFHISALQKTFSFHNIMILILESNGLCKQSSGAPEYALELLQDSPC